MLLRMLEVAGLYGALRTKIDGVKTSAVRSAIYAVAGLVAVVAIGFFVAALWIYLASLHGSVAASLIVGSGFLALAILIAAIATMVGSRTMARQPLAGSEPPVADAVAYVTSLVEGLEEHLGQGKNGLKAVGIAAAAGFIAAQFLRR